MLWSTYAYAFPSSGDNKPRVKCRLLTGAWKSGDSFFGQPCAVKCKIHDAEVSYRKGTAASYSWIIGSSADCKSDKKLDDRCIFLHSCQEQGGPTRVPCCCLCRLHAAVELAVVGYASCYTVQSHHRACDNRKKIDIILDRDPVHEFYCWQHQVRRKVWHTVWMQKYDGVLS